MAFIVLVSDNSMKGSVEPELLHHMLQVLEDPAFQVQPYTKTLLTHVFAGSRASATPAAGPGGPCCQGTYPNRCMLGRAVGPGLRRSDCWRLAFLSRLGYSAAEGWSGSRGEDVPDRLSFPDAAGHMQACSSGVPQLAQQHCCQP